MYLVEPIKPKLGLHCHITCVIADEIKCASLSLVTIYNRYKGSCFWWTDIHLDYICLCNYSSEPERISQDDSLVSRKSVSVSGAPGGNHYENEVGMLVRDRSIVCEIVFL